MVLLSGKYVLDYKNEISFIVNHNCNIDISWCCFKIVFRLKSTIKKDCRWLREIMRQSVVQLYTVQWFFSSSCICHKVNWDCWISWKSFLKMFWNQNLTALIEYFKNSMMQNYINKKTCFRLINVWELIMNKYWSGVGNIIFLLHYVLLGF